MKKDLTNHDLLSAINAGFNNMQKYFEQRLNENIGNLDKKIESMDEKLSKQVANVDRKLSKQVAAVDKKLSRQIDGVDYKIDQLHEITTNRVASSEYIQKNHEKRLVCLEEKVV